MEEAVATVVAAFGGIDILCANAGIYPSATLEEMSERTWDDVFTTNLKGMLFSSKAALLKAKYGGPHRADVVHYGAIHGVPWLVALRGDQSRDGGIHAHRGPGAGTIQDYY
jgi:3-oxoacyl-[acyl-carrier protein] reductase